MIAFLDESGVLRRREALKADAELRRVAAGEGATALALGDTLCELFEDGKLAKLHCAREKDYMRERLGIPPRTGYQFLKLARETSPHFSPDRAVLSGSRRPCRPS